MSMQILRQYLIWIVTELKGLSKLSRKSIIT